MKFPDMPKKHTKAILLSGVIAGLIVAIMSYFEIGLFSLGLIVISILGSSHDLSIIFGGKNNDWKKTRKKRKRARNAQH